jgi:NAD(P)-dependent dehydrogenase (short-subunit alcohol dehydrogenase family)
VKGEMEEKVALVTGGGSEIGRATALVFAREGAKVVVADTAMELGEETVRLIQKSGGEAVFVKCDVTKGVEVEAMVNKAVETYSKLDCAFNNAGEAETFPSASTVDHREGEWDQMVNIYLKGVWLCMKYEISRMLKQTGGAIVNTSSALGLFGAGNFSAYVAAKHGVLGLTKTAAIEYAKVGIRVNAICPGFTLTPTIEKRLTGNLDILKSYIPMGRLADPKEMAEVVLWLCSDKASWVTGTPLIVDGGLLA